MKITNTERTYCIEVTERQFRRIMDRDDRSFERYDMVSGKYSYPDTLCSQVCKLDNVRRVEYDPMTGGCIFVTVEEPFEQTIQNAKEVVAKYVR